MIDFCSKYSVLLFISILVKTFNIICIVVPLSIIIIVMINIFKAILAKDNEALTKAIKSSLKKLIPGIVIFIMPTIGFVLINLLNESIDANVDLYTCYNNSKNLSYYKQLHDDYLARLEAQHEEPPYDDVPIATDPDANPDEKIYGKKYKLTEEELRFIAGVSQCEQGHPDGVAAEATLIANRFELHPRGNLTDIYNYTKSSGWWACARHGNNPSDVSIARTKSVIVDGLRTMPLYIDEHDCIKCGKSYDIIELEINGRSITDEKELLNRSNYIKNKTIIHNRYESVYTFYKFPCERCDPFGYTPSGWSKVNK